ncbi:hypothetical protein DPSP01_011252 [Paraphaeosphaeria sporulosa]
MKRCGRLDEQLEAIAMISKSWKLHSMSGDRQHYFQLSDMLRRFADYKCSDPRDCRHALHNMATDLERSKSIAGPNYMLPRIPFAVDYSLNMKDTYHAMLLASGFCCASMSHKPTEGLFVRIDGVGSIVAIADNLDSFFRALMKLYYEVSHNYRTWWVSETNVLAQILVSLLDILADMTDALGDAFYSIAQIVI